MDEVLRLKGKSPFIIDVFLLFDIMKHGNTRGWCYFFPLFIRSSTDKQTISKKSRTITKQIHHQTKEEKKKLTWCFKPACLPIDNLVKIVILLFSCTHRRLQATGSICTQMKKVFHFKRFLHVYWLIIAL